MRFTRLAVEARGRTLALSFHPRLTVITGVGSATRESLVQELLAGLCTHRSGTHLEIATDAGRALAVFRPSDAAHRVIDTATGNDVSSEFATTDGDVDIIASFGLEHVTARRWSRIGPNDLVASTQSQQLVARLAHIDQAQLWSAAQRVQIASQALQEQETAVTVEDEGLTERIEHNYHAHDAALEQADQTRILALGLGTISLVGAAALATTSAVASLILVAVAVVATIVAFIFRARVNHFAHALSEALGESGSESYLGYQLDRIDTYMDSEHRRRHRAAAEADVNEAMELWRRTAGDVTVDWALDHRSAIEAAANIHASTPQNAGPGTLLARNAADEAPELIEALVTRAAKARHLGRDGESFPLLLDEPFGALEPQVRPVLLESLVSLAGSPQVILLTNSEDIVSWARLEELTGVLSLIGPDRGARPRKGSGGHASPADAAASGEE